MLKVLYAEDNVGMRKMVSHYLNIIGFAIDAFEDGDEIIPQLFEEKYDVIILDVTMERLDGYQTAQAIRRSNSDNKDVPIIGLTARTESAEIQQAYNSGMSVVLSKPVQLEYLVEVIEECVSSHDFNVQEAINELKPNIKNEDISANNHLSIIDISALTKYKEIAGASSLEGILHDFSDLWPRKIGEIYSNIIMKDADLVSRAGEELTAIAAAIGAAKVVYFSSTLTNSDNYENSLKILEDIVRSCREVQNIINQIR